MQRLMIHEIHPFCRKIGIADGLEQLQFVKSYDHRLFIVLDSGGTLEIEDSTYLLKENDVFLVAPGVQYRIKLSHGQRAIVINFDWTMQYVNQHNLVLSDHLQNYQVKRIINKMDWQHYFPNPEYVVLKAPLTVVRLALNLVRQSLSPYENTDLRDMMLSGIFLQILSILMREKTQTNPNAQIIYNFISMNFDRKITLDALSKRFHFCPTYINRLLVANYNISLKKLLIKLRLEHAVFLLDTSSLTIKEIAERSGFYDDKHLQRSFMKNYNISLHQYRN